MIDKQTIQQIVEEIKKTDDWIHTLPEEGDEEFLHHYMALEIFDNIVIICEFYNHGENSTEYAKWKEGKIVKVTREEDWVMSAGHNEGLRDETDYQDIILRDHNNHIYEGDSEFPSPKEAK